MNATYFESTKKLIVTDGHYYVLRARVPTRHHLNVTLYNKGLRLNGKHWKKLGGLYTARLRDA